MSGQSNPRPRKDEDPDKPAGQPGSICAPVGIRTPKLLIRSRTQCPPRALRLGHLQGAHAGVSAGQRPIRCLLRACGGPGGKSLSTGRLEGLLQPFLHRRSRATVRGDVLGVAAGRRLRRTPMAPTEGHSAQSGRPVCQTRRGCVGSPWSPSRSLRSELKNMVPTGFPGTRLEHHERPPEQRPRFRGRPDVAGGSAM